MLRIVTDFPVVVVDEDGRHVVEDSPEPLLAGRGEAFKVGGALVSVLVRRQDTRRAAWTLTSRQEIHPDDFDRTGELLSWLATKADEAHRHLDDRVELGRIRFHEESRPEPLTVYDGEVGWPS